MRGEAPLITEQFVSHNAVMGSPFSPFILAIENLFVAFLLRYLRPAWELRRREERT